MNETEIKKAIAEEQLKGVTLEIIEHLKSVYLQERWELFDAEAIGKYGLAIAKFQGGKFEEAWDLLEEIHKML